MEKARTTEQANPAPSGRANRANRALVAAYLHELSERHGGSWRRDAVPAAATAGGTARPG